ncbi:nuclease-related domain-containing protein [Neobacillus sp. Marseille-QA0830]
METFMKPRPFPKELKILRSLNSRMVLPEKERKRYVNLQKGYEGEVMFDARAEEFTKDRYILNDLLLETNNTSFQIDSTFITQRAISFYEVKNYEGEYLYDPKTDRFTSQYDHDITNPLHQSGRSEILLRQLLHSKGYKVPIHYYIIFINPEFYSLSSEAT